MLGGFQPLFSGARTRGPLISFVKDTEYTYAFSARASEVREISVSVGGHDERFVLRAEWQRFALTFTADQSGTSRPRFNVGRESSNVFINSVYLFEGNANIFRRDFDNGIVLVNATPRTRSISLDGTFRRINGQQDSTNNGSTLSSITLAAHESAILIRRESDLPQLDVQAPWVNISAPTKLRVGPITNTSIVVNDQLAINANEVRLSPDNTAGVDDFNCNQINVRQVRCSLTIDRSGELKIRVTDVAGNTSTETESGFQINGGTTGDASIPLITINAPTKIANEPIRNTTITVTDNTEIRATDVAIRDITTAGIDNFNCAQSGSRQVTCTIDIISSGDLSLIATDAAGNVHLNTENDYVINGNSSGGSPSNGNPGPADTTSPIITYIAPTKISNQTILDTSIMIRDEVEINPSGIELRPTTTAQTSNFNCQQEDITTVVCSLSILSSGDILLSATDRAGNTRFRSENGYVINRVNDTSKPFILVDAGTKTSNSTIQNTVITVRDLVGIDVANISIRDNSTVGVSNFNCQQVDATTARCTLDILSSGDLLLTASDLAGNVTYKTETGYQINQSDDTGKPFILLNAPTKTSNGTIQNTTFTVRDGVAIDAADVSIRDISTVGVSNFNCSQVNVTTVSCTLNITSSGDLLLTAKDRAGNVTYKTETGYQINQASDATKPFIVLNAPTKTSNGTIQNTTFTVRDGVAIDASDVSIRDISTVGVSNFNCSQVNNTTVSCALNITSSGDLLLTARDRAGNATYKTETGYQIN